MRIQIVLLSHTLYEYDAKEGGMKYVTINRKMPKIGSCANFHGYENECYPKNTG